MARKRLIVRKSSSCTRRVGRASSTGETSAILIQAGLEPRSCTHDRLISIDLKIMLRYICRGCLYAAVWCLQLCVFGSSGAQPLRIHFVAHSHDDPGWLKTVDQCYTGSHQHIQNAAVEYILDSVVQCLGANRDRTFSFGEIAFFSRWWIRQTPETQSQVCSCFTSDIHGSPCSQHSCCCGFASMKQHDQTPMGCAPPWTHHNAHWCLKISHT